MYIYRADIVPIIHGGPITTLQLPAATGGDGTLVYSWPSRPSELNFNASTWQMTGIPTANTTSMTCTVTDTDTIDFDITVREMCLVNSGGGRYNAS